jgi:hypothetical protein
VALIHSRHIQSANEKLQAMDMNARLLLADRIFESQPELLGAVLVQQKLGTSPVDLEFLIELLMVCVLSVNESGLEIPRITEDIQELTLKIVSSRVLITQGLSSQETELALAQQIEQFNEPNLLAFAQKGLQQKIVNSGVKAINSSYILCALNLVESMSYVLHLGR